MLATLHEAEDALPDLLREGVDAWRSLDIDYEPPHVERLWRPWGPVVSTGAMTIPSRFRLSLHRIHPCETALFHPHPWPSAVRIITCLLLHLDARQRKREPAINFPDSPF